MRAEEQLKELKVHTRRPSEHQDTVVEGSSDTGHTGVKMLLQVRTTTHGRTKQPDWIKVSDVTRGVKTDMRLWVNVGVPDYVAFHITMCNQFIKQFKVKVPS